MFGVGAPEEAPTAKLDVDGTFNATSSQGTIALDSNGNVLIGI